MLKSGNIGQSGQIGRSDLGGLGGINAKPLEPSALGMLTKRLHSQVVAAQSIENDVEGIARRLGGSAPTGPGETAKQDASGQIQPPRIDELNGLVDLLSQSLARTEDEVQRLRRMVD